MPENQAGFRKRRKVLDNIYVINYVVGENLNKKGGRVIAYRFIDLMAFDSVDKKELVDAMRERGMRERLVRKCGDIYRETRNRVREEAMSREFWTGKGIRQR